MEGERAEDRGGGGGGGGGMKGLERESGREGSGQAEGKRELQRKRREGAG